MTRVATSVAVESLADPAGPSSVALSTAAGLDTLVVIGNGMAGHRLCRRLIELGARRRYRIVVFGEEPLPAYDRVHLTDVFTGRRAHDLLLSPGPWYAEHGIDLRLDDPVVEIDRSRRTVRAASGAELEYGVFNLPDEVWVWWILGGVVSNLLAGAVLGGVAQKLAPAPA